MLSFHCMIIPTALEWQLNLEVKMDKINVCTALHAHFTYLILARVKQIGTWKKKLKNIQLDANISHQDTSLQNFKSSFTNMFWRFNEVRYNGISRNLFLHAQGQLSLSWLQSWEEIFTNEKITVKTRSVKGTGYVAGSSYIQKISDTSLTVAIWTVNTMFLNLTIPKIIFVKMTC
jgi:hypothetical protein